jgi:hypothetical protein
MSRRAALLASILCLFTAAVAVSSTHRPASIPVLQADPCLQSCIGSDDPICCRWHCHPIGQNPC